MPQFLAEELAETMLAALGEALDLVDCGFMLLDQDMQVRFISETFAQLTGIEQRLNGDIRLRDLFGPHWEAEIRCRPVAGVLLDLPEARHLAIGCRATSEGYLLSCSRLSALAIEPQPPLPGEEDRLCADLRFDKEVLEDQAAHLASLAEESDANARRAEKAKRELEREIVRRRQLEAELQRLATTDPLTGAFNRRQIFALGRQVLRRLRRSKQAFGLLMIDIDHFKMINDRHGHPVGDAALKHVVHCLRAGLRQTDLIGRVGGEEFAIMLPTTTIDDALRVAERLRTRVATKALKQGSTTICMTISIGLAMARQTDHGLEQIIARADTQLYRAKEGGRNRVCHDEKTCPGPRQLIRRPEAALSGNGSRAFYRQGLRFCPLKDAVYEIGGSTIGPSIKRAPLFAITAQPETRGIFKLLATVIMRSRFSTASPSENAAIASGGFALTAASALLSWARFAVLRKSSRNPSSCASRKDQPVHRPRHHVMGWQSPRRGGPMALVSRRGNFLAV